MLAAVSSAPSATEDATGAESWDTTNAGPVILTGAGSACSKTTSRTEAADEPEKPPACSVLAGEDTATVEDFGAWKSRTEKRVAASTAVAPNGK